MSVRHPSIGRFRGPRTSGTRSAGSRAVLGFVCAAAVALTAACGSSTGPAADSPSMGPSTASPESPEPTTAETPAPAAPAPAAEFVVTIKDFMYDVPDSVPAGSTITVVNEDAEPHTVTAAGNKAFDINVAGGATETFTAEAGTYELVCLFHGNMKGTLVVELP